MSMHPVLTTPLVAIGAGVYTREGMKVVGATGDDEERGPEYDEQLRYAVLFAAAPALVAALREFAALRDARRILAQASGGAAA